MVEGTIQQREDGDSRSAKTRNLRGAARGVQRLIDDDCIGIEIGNHYPNHKESGGL